MNTSRILFGFLALSALPVLAQPEIKPVNGLPYPLISPAEVMRLADIKPIKLHLRDVTLKTALEEVQKQTVITLDFRFGGNQFLEKKLSIDIETNSLNEATDAIFEEADVKAVVQKMGRGNRLIVMTGTGQPKKETPLSGIFPFQIRLDGLDSSVNRNIELRNPPIRRETTALSAHISLETSPQIPLVLSPRIEVTSAVDNLGSSLVNNDRMPFFEGNIDYAMPIQLRTPQKGAKEITKLEGKITYAIATKKETWEAPDILNAKDVGHDFQAGENKVHFSVVSARKTNNAIQLEVNVTALNGTTPVMGGFNFDRNQVGHPLMQFNQLSSAIRLVDAKGQTLESGGFGGRGGNNQLTGQVTYNLPRVWLAPEAAGQVGVMPEQLTLTEPVKLIVESPSEIVQTQVPFSFSHIPLP